MLWYQKCRILDVWVKIMYMNLIQWLLNHLKTKRRQLYLKTHPVPRSKHLSSRL
jgi:hypothetical protein